MFKWHDVHDMITKFQNFFFFYLAWNYNSLDFIEGLANKSSRIYQEQLLIIQIWIVLKHFGDLNFD